MQVTIIQKDRFFSTTHTPDSGIALENGGVYKIVQSGTNIRINYELVNKFGRDAGIKKGDIGLRGSYNTVNSTLLLQTSMILSPHSKHAYRHCGTMFGEKKNYGVFPIRLQDGSYVTDAWQVQSRTGKICSMPRTHQISCRMVGCDRYEKDNSKSLLIKNRARAIKIGSQKQRAHKGGKSFAETAAEARRNDRKRGYKSWDPSEEARKSTDQILIDWWLSN